MLAKLMRTLFGTKHQYPIDKQILFIVYMVCVFLWIALICKTITNGL